MQNCTDYQDLCSLALDDELSAQEQAALGAHLAACPACAEYMEQLRDMQKLFAASDVPVPSSLHEDIMEVVAAQAQANIRPVTKRRYVPVFTMMAGAVAAVLLVTTGTMGNLFGSLPQPAASSDAAISGAAADSAPAPAAFSAPQPPAASAAPAEGAAPADAPAAASAAPADSPAPAAPRKDADSAAPQLAPRKNEGGAQATVRPAPPAAPPQAAPSQAAPAPQLAAAPPAGASQNRAALGDSPPAGARVQLPETPAALREQSYAFCYVAMGSAALPDFGGTLAAEAADGAAYYFTVKNNMSTIEKALGALSDAKYDAVQQNEVPKITFDTKAENGLIIVLRQ